MSKKMVVPVNLKDKVIGEIEKLNKRCVKLGIELVKYTISEPYFIKHELVNGTKRTFEVMDFEVDKPEVSLEGYHFRAVIDRSLGIVLVNGMGTKGLYHDVEDTRCDHCHTKHKRNKQVVLFDANTEEELVVGKTCMKDFLGHSSMSASNSIWALIARLEGFDELMDDEIGGAYRTGGAEGIDALKLMIAVTDSWKALGGWVKSEDYPYQTNLTMDRARVLLENPIYEENFDGDVVAEAKAIIDWATEYTKTQTETYWRNIGNLLELNLVPEKLYGLVGSAICGYKKMLQDIERAKIIEDCAWVGDIDKRMNFAEMEVTCINSFENYYGMTFFINFKTQDDNVVVWKTSSRWISKLDHQINEGDVLTFDAKVTKHDTYNELKQTYVNRPTKWTVDSAIEAE